MICDINATTILTICIANNKNTPKYPGLAISQILEDKIKIDNDRYGLVREIFYTFSCYDALDFEIACIHKNMLFLKELHLSEINRSKYPEKDIIQRMNGFLHIMLICKFCHFAETLGATSLAFLSAKMKGTFIRYSKNDEEKRVLDFLAKYEVGDVVNFFRDIRKRENSYVADFMGYQPLFMQEKDKADLYNTSCNTIKELLDSIGRNFIKYLDIYNAYKHGYRTIPTVLNESIEAMLYVKDNGQPEILQIPDVNETLKLSGYCRSILQDIVENHRSAMRVSYNQDKNFTIRIHFRKLDGIKQTSFNQIFASREDLLKNVREEEKEVLKKIGEIEKYRGKFILLDLDDDRSRQIVIEYYYKYRRNEDHRRVITRLTDKYLQEIQK